MASNPNYSDVTPAIQALAALSLKNSCIDSGDYTRCNVKRGLRDMNGQGVVAGLTEISEICSSKLVDGKKVSCEGQLFYRGYSIEDLVRAPLKEKRFGFEEVAYLLLFGQLPTRDELEAFSEQLSYYRSLPNNFVRDVILKAPSQDMMNGLARCVLTMASYDENPDDISLPNVVRQCMQLLATFPLFAVYNYQAYNYKSGSSLFIHAPHPELSTAENILSLLRADSRYSFWEAHILDICLMLHAEHGGGNNSTFTTHVVTSSGTDTYSCMAAALASLKGPKHGGANIKVIRMFEDMKKHVHDWTDEEEITRYLHALLRGEAFDRTGLIYGMGHAVYSLSDPRANILRGFVETLSREKGRTEEYQLYARVERLAPQVIADERKIYKGVSANVDFYSGFVYHMLNLPLELYTPIFAIARIAGWGAHRIEELINMGKIIRPAYVYVGQRQNYLPIADRDPQK
ncbi:MAG: citrate/2-methylcitrate synthase [Intestinimonas sp.]|nr:citrate/2-methylcitrate synthase [Intestinimonas sp.]